MKKWMMFQFNDIYIASNELGLCCSLLSCDIIGWTTIGKFLDEIATFLDVIGAFPNLPLVRLQLNLKTIKIELKCAYVFRPMYSTRALYPSTIWRATESRDN